MYRVLFVGCEFFRKFDIEYSYISVSISKILLNINISYEYFQWIWNVRSLKFSGQKLYLVVRLINKE